MNNNPETKEQKLTPEPYQSVELSFYTKIIVADRFERLKMSARLNYIYLQILRLNADNQKVVFIENLKYFNNHDKKWECAGVRLITEEITQPEYFPEQQIEYLYNLEYKTDYTGRRSTQVKPQGLRWRINQLTQLGYQIDTFCPAGEPPEEKGAYYIIYHKK
jgi:hypothetical protein